MALRIVAACEVVSCLFKPDLKRTVNVDVISVTAIIFERLLATGFFYFTTVILFGFCLVLKTFTISILFLFVLTQ